MKSIGFAGTAKNAGKTTAMIEALAQGLAAGLRPGLTSIGYDGENRDNVTGLPKPRIQVQDGVIFATAESCLKTCTAPFQVCSQTEIHTALGKIVIARATGTGLVLLAGPNRRSELARLFGLLESLAGVEVVLVDGALNRLVPLIGTDGLVLSTGAALEADIAALVRHTRALFDLYRPALAAPKAARSGRISLLSRAGDLRELDSGSLLSAEAAGRFVLELDQPVDEMVIPGACDPRYLARLLQERAVQLDGARLFFGSPWNLAASGHPLDWAQVLANCDRLAVRLAFLEKNEVYSLTVNPFYPRYVPQTGAYQPAYIDKVALLAEMRAAGLGVDVIDVRQPPTPDLLRLCHLRPEGGK